MDGASEDVDMMRGMSCVKYYKPGKVTLICIVR